MEFNKIFIIVYISLNVNEKNAVNLLYDTVIKIENILPEAVELITGEKWRIGLREIQRLLGKDCVTVLG